MTVNNNAAANIGDLDIVRGLDLFEVNSELLGIDAKYNEIFWIIYTAKMYDLASLIPTFDNINPKVNVRFDITNGTVKCPHFLADIHTRVRIKRRLQYKATYNITHITNILTVVCLVLAIIYYYLRQQYVGSSGDGVVNLPKEYYIAPIDL